MSTSRGRTVYFFHKVRVAQSLDFYVVFRGKLKNKTYTTLSEDVPNSNRKIVEIYYVVCFVITFGRKLTIGLEFEVNIKKWGRERVVSVVCFISRALGYIDGIQLAKCRLLIDRASLMYLKVRLKASASVFFVFDKLFA